MAWWRKKEEPDYNEECTRCSRDVLAVHPLGWLVMHVVSPVNDEQKAVILCALCMSDFGEFLCPELKGHAVWLSEKDQLHAEIRDRLGE
jgi:hypothetical protein